MSAHLLDVVLAPEAGAFWTKSIRPVAKEIGFKPARPDPRWRRGRLKESPNSREFFWFQIDQRFGFDIYMGGQFVVANFVRMDEIPTARTDVWCRFATRADAMGGSVIKKKEEQP